MSAPENAPEFDMGGGHDPPDSPEHVHAAQGHKRQRQDDDAIDPEASSSGAKSPRTAAGRGESSQPTTLSVPRGSAVSVKTQAGDEDMSMRIVTGIEEQATLHEKEATLHEKEATLHEKEATLHEKEATLHEKEATPHEKEAGRAAAGAPALQGAVDANGVVVFHAGPGTPAQEAAARARREVPALRVVMGTDGVGVAHTARGNALQEAGAGAFMANFTLLAHQRGLD